MKILFTLFLILSIALCLFNVLEINWDNLLEEKSIIAIIGVMASAISIMLLLILMISKRIHEKLKK